MLYMLFMLYKYYILKIGNLQANIRYFGDIWLFKCWL